MSTDKGGKKPGGPGFLGDDDLLAELDQWDKTFDALHTEGPPDAEPAKTAAKPAPLTAPIPAPPPKTGPIPGPPQRKGSTKPPPPPPGRGSVPKIEPIAKPAPDPNRTIVSPTPLPPSQEAYERGDDDPQTLDRGQPADPLGDLAVGDLAVGDETDFS